MRTSPVLRFPLLSAFGARAALRALTALALATTGGLGCSSNSQPSGPACNPCGPTGPQIGRSTNPDGVAYPSPTAGFGRNARVGSTPGDVMQNFKFYGYPGADASKGLQPISLSDYYDPCGKRLKLLHLTAAALWCVPCNQETDAIVEAKDTLVLAGIAGL